MARILAYTTPRRGHLYPLIPILQGARRRGHQVVLRTLAAEAASMRQRGSPPTRSATASRRSP